MGPVEWHTPESAVVLEPQVGVGQRLGIDPTVVLAAFDLTVDEAGALQHHYVLGNGIEGDGEGPGNFGDGGGPLGKRLQDGAASGIGERREDVIEFRGLGMFNHMVEY